MLPRGRVYRYPPGRNMSDIPIGGAPGGMLSVPYSMGGVPIRDTPYGQPMSTGALASSLANATPDQQRTVSLLVQCICRIYNLAFTTAVFLFCGGSLQFCRLYKIVVSKIY